ncbi:MAG: hypothetical protein IJB75_00265 [Oscillospiraceae bacterium]|nr:hypothetical protein [Oscillospiraceae bacterium]
MLLIFALAAAVCLRGLAWADSTSKHNRNCDLAMAEVQSAAAILQNNGGDLAAAAEIMGGRADEQRWAIHYNEQWEQTDGAGAFILSVRFRPTPPLMSSARITVTGDDELLAELTVSWQEVTADEG